MACYVFNFNLHDLNLVEIGKRNVHLYIPLDPFYPKRIHFSLCYQRQGILFYGT